MRLLNKALSVITALVMICMTAFAVGANAAQAVQASIVVSQTIHGIVDAQSYTYKLVPQGDNDVLPDGDTVLLIGNTDKSFTLSFTEPGTYDYKLYQLREDGSNNLEAKVYDFGFFVKAGADNSLIVIPYTCTDPDLKLLITSEDDVNGVKCEYAITGTNEEPSDNPTKPDINNDNKNNNNNSGSSVTPGKSSNSTNVTATTKSTVNTGDENQVLLWSCVLGLGFIGMIIILLLRRREREENV